MIPLKIARVGHIQKGQENIPPKIARVGHCPVPSSKIPKISSCYNSSTALYRLRNFIPKISSSYNSSTALYRLIKYLKFQVVIIVALPCTVS